MSVPANKAVIEADNNYGHTHTHTHTHIYIYTHTHIAVRSTIPCPFYNFLALDFTITSKI